jgi:hypothetical protein
MNFSRCLAAVVCALAFSLSARANLFVVDISTRTYSLDGDGEVQMHAGNKVQFVDLAAQNSGVAANTLVLVYDTDADALEVVRKADGSLIQTVMYFIADTDVENSKKIRAYRQAFLSLTGSTVVSGTTVVTGTAVVSGSTSIDGSVAGPVRVEYDRKANIIAYRWDGDFQYSIPGNTTTLNRVVHGRFTLGHEVKVKITP